jgi:hypothetical protein
VSNTRQSYLTLFYEKETMMNFLSKTQSILLEFERLPTAAITLSEDAINQALELSRQINNTSRQWQTYLNALALFAFERWVEKRDDSLSVNREECTVLQPEITNIFTVADKLKIGEFKLCVIATGSLTDEEITLPRAVVDIPEFVAHFYVLVEVLEEQECAVVRAVTTHQELMKNLRNANLEVLSDWTYQIPVTWFVDHPDQLLLYLRCLEPEAIPLPIVPKERVDNLWRMQSELTALLPHLQIPERELWEVLTWEQGTAVLTSPEILSWIYNMQKQDSHTSTQTSLRRTSYLSDLIKLLTQPALNVGYWLWDELDELAQEFSWALLPRLAPITEMRSATEEFEAIVSQFQQQHLEIPVQARAAFKDLLLAGTSLRLYAVTWHLLSETDSPQWTLLLILGAPLPETLPENLKLRVSDQTGILVEQGVNPQRGNDYLFTRVVGNWDEKFVVSVSLMDGVELTLPPFAFDLERSPLEGALSRELLAGSRGAGEQGSRGAGEAGGE